MSLAFTKYFIASQRAAVPDLQKSFAGQTIIVTGSNTGLGFESAKHYVRLGAEKVILAVRSVEKGNAAKEKIDASTGRAGVTEVWNLDMSSYASIQEFATKAQNLDRIDVLLENAGVNFYHWETSVDGTEMVMAVNVYGTIFLALLMLPLLRQSAQKHNTNPVLTIVGSEVHHFTQLKEEIESGDPLAYLQDEKKFSASTRYNISKLLELFYVRELAKHLDLNKHGVVVNLANPGFCHSEFDRNLPWFSRNMLAFGRWLLARQTVDGARALVFPSTAGTEGHGQYSLDGKFSEKAVSRWVKSDEGAKQQKYFYEAINARLEQVKPSILSNALAI